MAQVICRAVHDPTLVSDIPGLAERLQANALSLADLVSDVLDLASFDSGRVELHESEFSLSELLVEECRRLVPLAQAKNLPLTAEPVVPPVWIRADRIKLARVLGNLITNAIKFTEAGGVFLSAEVTQEGVLIRIRDTGAGIKPENLERIFDEFTQLQDPARERKGWGLGLPICRRLVEMMGGAIRVQSQPQRGSVFTVRLPPSCIVRQGDGQTKRAGSEKNGIRPACSG
jgi:signal transduction histidine kinase